MTFKYFYGGEADRYSFYRIPKLLFQDEYFKPLSSDAKILYGLMLDRMALSMKNHWFDEENRAYIYFSIEDIMELLNCGRNKAVNIMKELDADGGIGLIEKRRQGFGKANIIYVKTFMADPAEDYQTKAPARETIPDQPEEHMEPAEKFEKQTTAEKTDDTEVYILNFKKFKKQTSRSPENKLLEVYFSNSNYNNINNTYSNNNLSHLILSTDEITDTADDQRCDEIRCDENERELSFTDSLMICREQIRQNICLDDLILVHADEVQLIQGIYDLIVETILCKNEQILISSSLYPAQLVKCKFLKLEYTHIEYVLECLHKNETKVRNIRKYLLAALFNAPSTMDGYYKAEVNHDMPQYAGAR